MHNICLVFWKSELQYAYRRYACKKTCIWNNETKLTKKLLFYVQQYPPPYFNLHTRGNSRATRFHRKSKILRVLWQSL